MKTNYSTLLFVKRVKGSSSSRQRTIIYMHYKSKETPVFKAKRVLESKPLLQRCTSICFQVTGMSLGRYIKETNNLLQSFQKGS